MLRFRKIVLHRSTAWIGRVGLFTMLAVQPLAAFGAEPAEQVLLDKAVYWRLNSRPDLAAAALDKLLAAEPGQPDALYLSGMIAAQSGNVEKARQYLTRLREARPGSAQVAELETAIKIGPINTAELDEARRLVQDGKFDEAVQKYRQVFDGIPPPAYNLEYYQTLAGTPDGWDEARRNIEHLAQISGGDPKVALALAQLLTYREPTRREGIGLLLRLINDPTVGSAALRSWRAALLWMDAKPADKPFYDQYLARYPNDADVQKYFTEATTPGPALPADAARAEGFADLERGDIAGAERSFAQALQEQPEDADALGGLGLLRLRQQRFAEARDLLNRAMRAAPESKGHWLAAYDSASFWANVQGAKAALHAGNPQRARSILIDLLSRSRRENWGAELVLGDVETKLGNQEAAEKAYRQVLAVRPTDVDATIGLINTLIAQGKSTEAAALVDRLSTGGADRQIDLKRARAEILRAEAKELQADGRAAEAGEKYQSAVATDPANPWIRLDYAEFLDRQGERAQALAVIDPFASGSTPESYQAAAMFDAHRNRFADALSNIDQIPPGARSGDIKAYRDQILMPAEIERAKRLARAGNRRAARDVLIALYREPPIVPDKTRTVAYELIRMGDLESALAITRESAERGGPDATEATIDYVNVLLKANRFDEANTLLVQLRAGGKLTADDQADVDQAAAVIAVHRADKARKEGDIAAAQAQIAPLLSAHPNDPTLLMAAGRISADAGEKKQAISYIEAGYRQNPTDPQVINDAVWSAVHAGDFGLARTYLAQAIEADPKNPQLYYMKGQVERYGGNNRAAMQALETARSLNSEQGLVGDAMRAHPPQGAKAAPEEPTNSVQIPRPLPSGTMANSATSGTVQSGSSVVTAPAALLPFPPSSSDAPPSSNITRSLLIPPDADERPTPKGSVAPRSSAEDELERRRQVAQLQAAEAFAARINTAAGPLAITQTASLEAVAAPAAAADQPSPSSQPNGANTAENTLGVDINRSLSEIEAESAPVVQAGPVFAVRGGTAGLEQLLNVSSPIETSFSPWYTGTAYFAVTPTFLRAGTPSSSSLTQFGSNPILAAAMPGIALPSAGAQQANGVALGGGYSYRFFSGSIGSSPIGFRVQNLIGDLALCYPFPCGPIGPTGLSLWSGSPSNPVQLRVEGLRQPVTDTLLSYAGTQDPATGKIWGGVVKSGGRAVVLYDNGVYGGIASGGGAALTGQDVKSNSEGDGLVGAFFRPWRAGNDTVKVGANFSYIGYGDNLRFFSFGQGGYFSPQNYFDLSFPVEYSGEYGALRYRALAAAGVIHFNEKQSPYFPNNLDAQNTFEALVGNNNAFYQGKVVTTPGFNVAGQAEYAFDNGLILGTSAGVNNARDYTEGVVKLYLRDKFSARPPAAVFPDPSRGNL